MNKNKGDNSMAKEFTKAELQTFRKDFSETVTELEKKYGVSIKLGNISYNSSEFTGKIVVTKDGVSPFHKHAECFNQLHNIYGLSKDMLGKTFKTQGYELEFVGIDAKKPKYPCICAVSNDYNKSFKMTVEQLKYHLSK